MTLDEPDNPGTIDISVANDLALRVEIHPGGELYRLGRNDTQQIVGDMGPHWRLPALQWWEAQAISNACDLAPSMSHDQASSFALLLLAPVVWLTENETLAEAASAIEQAWIISELVDGDTASRFGQECANAMSVGPKYRWWNDPNLGSVTDSEWSLRYSERDPSSIKPINDLLASACDA